MLNRVARLEILSRVSDLLRSKLGPWRGWPPRRARSPKPGKMTTRSRRGRAESLRKAHSVGRDMVKLARRLRMSRNDLVERSLRRSRHDRARPQPHGRDRLALA